MSGQCLVNVCGVVYAVSFDDLMKSSAQQQQPRDSQPASSQEQQQQQEPPPSQQQQQQPAVAHSALVGSFKGSASQTRPIPPHVLDQEYDMVHQVGAVDNHLAMLLTHRTAAGVSR